MAISLLEMKTEMPDDFRKGVVSLLWENSRIMRLLNFIPFKGLAYPYSIVSKLPGISFRALNAQFAETQSVINPAVETLSVVGGRIKADTVLNQVKPNFRVNEIARQLEAAAKFWDKSFINGDPAVTDNSFLGLKPRIPSTSAQFITPAAGSNGSPVTMDDALRLLDLVEGDNSQKVLLMNRTIRRNLSHDVGKSAGGRRVFEAGVQETGLQVGTPGSPWTTFEGARVEEVFYDEAENPILPFTETQGGSNACTSMYCFRPGNAIDERYVQGISGLSPQFDVRGPIDFGEYLIDVVQGLFGIGLFSGYGVARLAGLTATPS